MTERLPPEGGVAVTPPGCVHSFVHLSTAYWVGNGGGYSTQYHRLDMFFCSKCLEQKEVKREEWSRETPDWYRGRP